MSHSTILHRAVRPAVRLLEAAGLRPNHVTAARITCAVAAAAAFGLGTPGSVWLGAGLFILSGLLDRADGDLARLTGQFSALGHRLDLIGDFCADALAFIAMGIGARTSWLGWHAPMLGAAAAIGTGLLFWRLNTGAAARPQPVRARLADPDDMILMAPLIAGCFGLPPVLLLAGTVTPLAALWLMGTQSWRQRAAPVRPRPVRRPRNPSKPARADAH